MTGKCYQIYIDKELEIMVNLFSGKVYPKDMLDFLEDLYGHNDYNPVFETIYDFSESLAIGYQIDVAPFVTRLRKFRSVSSANKKVGIIARTPNQKFLINLFQKFAPLFNLQIKVFEDSVSCVKWVKENVELQDRVLDYLIKVRSKSIDFQF